jgi:hypothetical protein
VASPGEAIATMSTGDVTLADDQVAFCKTFDVIAYAINNADKLMADYHRHRNRFLRPNVPVVDMHIGATDGRFQDPDQHFITADFWNRNILEPKAGLCFCFYNSLHGLHDTTLGQSEKHEKVFATSNGSMENHLPRVFALTYQPPFWQKVCESNQ